MRYPSPEPLLFTLVGRVALVATLAAVVGSSLAAAAAVLLAEAAIVSADDRRMRDEATEIAVEVQGLSGDAFARLIDEELGELSLAGLRLAVYRDGALMGGDGRLPPYREGCVTEPGASELRVCTIARGPWTAVVAANEAPPRLRQGMKWAIIVGAVVVAVAIGAAASRALARWAVGPLIRLRARLGAAPMDEAVNLGSDEDVREIDALRHTLRALLDKRAQALRSARLFTAGAAHELRTPLTTLSGELELLAEEPLPAPALERIEGLRESTGRIADLVERLLVLARVGAAEAMREDAVELGDLVEDIVGRLPAAEAPRFSCEKRAPTLVRGDESFLAVLCENAITNALLHARSGAVRVVLDERDSDVLLDVIDEGPGISSSDRERLFEPFRRGVTAAAGAGLGLALVAQIARSHGGEAVFLDASRGAHLRVRLPRWAPREQAARAPVPFSAGR